MRTLLALAALAAIAAAIVLAQPRSDPRPPAAPRPAATAPPPTPSRTPAPSRLKPSEINRQDRTSRRHRDREARAFDARPLLDRLPFERDDVRIDLAGLAADDQTTVLAIDPGRASRAHARAIYERALRRAGDRGTVYVLEWAR